MLDFGRLDALLREWESSCQAGRPVDPGQLCSDWPEGAAELRRRAALLQKFDAAFLIDAAAPDGPPVIPGCSVLGELGRGGMGVVYRALQESLGREVAVKVLRGGVNMTPHASQRFALEARLLARLRHDCIVPVYEAALHLGRPYFVMELVRGGNLAGSMARFAGNPAAAARLVEQVARAVHYAHERGVLHRDLKPANILLDEHGRPHVSDFGLAKLVGARPEVGDGGECPGLPEPGGPLTAVGAAAGTPPYMAPEQFRGAPAVPSPRTDVWALGVILYELLTGRRPFTGDGPGGFARSVCEDWPAPLRLARGADGTLQAIVSRCLEKDPARRYPTAADLADDLTRWLGGEAPRALKEWWPRRLWRRVRRRPWAVAAAVLAAVGTAIWASAAYLSDPERVREAVRRDLAAGRPVTFVGATGPPVCFGWGEGEKAAKASWESDRPFFVSTHATALVELWPTPPPAFRLRAEVRHDDNSGDGRVGVYFDHRRAGAAPWPCCYVVSFCDRGPSSTSFRGPGGQAGSRVRMTFNYFRPRPGSEPVEGTQTVNDGLFFVPPSPSAGEGHWRTVDVRISPRAADVSWTNDRGEAERVARVSRDQFAFYTRLLPLSEPEMAGYAFDPTCRAAVGLYVRDSSCSFRNVVLEPSPSDP